MNEGTIYKATGGFYYVYCTDSLDIECRARGIFRKTGTKPVVGDRVRIQVNADGSGTVDEILPRKNDLVRPPLANLDYMVAVLSVTDPAPNLAVVDKFLAVLEHKEIEPLIAITKSDIEPPDARISAAALTSLYHNAGFAVFATNFETGEGLSALKEALAGKFSAFSGNSGVGKSTLLNAIDPQLALETGDTSKKLGRGRHTTRTVETYRLQSGGFVADTPGFTSLELTRISDITKEELAGCFREFTRYVDDCKFQDCSHTCEKGCAVLAAVQQGDIAPSRHASYCQLYDEIKEIPQWERR